MARQVFNGHTFALYNVDCIAGMRERLAPKSIDVVVTSPPYNLGIKYKRYDDTISRQDYLRWMGEWAEAVKRVLRDDGSLFLNIGSKPSDPWVPFEVLAEMRKYFKLQNVIHWVKSIAIQKEDVGDYPGITGNVSVGHFKPINSPRYVNDCHEYIFHLTKRGDVKLDRLAIGVEYQDKSNVTRWRAARGDKRCRERYQQITAQLAEGDLLPAQEGTDPGQQDRRQEYGYIDPVKEACPDANPRPHGRLRQRGEKGDQQNDQRRSHQ